VIVRELERAGIPTAHICTMTPVAQMAGSNRIVTGFGVVHPIGNVDVGAGEEKALRRALINKAIEVLQTELTGQKHFSLKG